MAEVWINGAMLAITSPLEMARLLEADCESEAERSLCRHIVCAAVDALATQEEAGGGVIVRTQCDLSRTHNLPYRADFLVISPRRGLMVIEVDGFAYHSDQAAFKRDRIRDRAFALIRLPVIRFTALECTEMEADGPTFDELRRALGGA